MWPWEHVAVGYLAVSALAHGLAKRSPTGPEAVAVAVASLGPDLLDKPLGWEFRVFESGYGIGHSVFFAVPLALAAFLTARARGRTGVGVAVAVGYLLHLPGDLLYGFLYEGHVPFARVLWPLRSTSSTYPGGFSGTLVEYLREYVHGILTGDVGPAVLLGVAAFLVCLAVWLYDGAPGLAPLFDRIGSR